MKRLGPNAHAFTMEITPLAPPSVQLVPAKEYNGAPIGTSYDVRAYIGEGNKTELDLRGLDGLIVDNQRKMTDDRLTFLFFLFIQKKARSFQEDFARKIFLQFILKMCIIFR